MIQVRWGIIILVIIFCAIHSAVLFLERPKYLETAHGKNFEDVTLVAGDHSFYRNSILSLGYSFEDRLKTFQSAQYPGFHNVPPGTFSKFENAYAFAFPYPPYKAGFAWSGALLSFFIPKAFFENIIPRVATVNFLLSLFCLLLVFYITENLTKNTVSAYIASVLFMTDIVLLHTAYTNQTHTVSGLFWFLLAFYLFLRTSKPLLYGLCLGMAFQSSPHVLAWTAALLLVSFFKLKKEEIFWTIAGFLIPILYLISVDLILDFHSKNIPGYLAHIKKGGIDETALLSIPLLNRWIWDIRLVQPYILPCLTVMLLLSFKSLKNIPAYFYYILILGFLGSFITNLPVIRTLLPFMTVFVIFLGSWLGLARNRIVQVTILGIWICSSFYLLEVFKIQNIERPSPNIFVVDDHDEMLQNQLAYFRHIRTGNSERPVPPVHFKYSSDSLETFVSKMELSTLDKSNLYIEIRPTDIADAYVATYRFFPKYINQPWHVVSRDEISNDFRLFNELMTYKKTAEQNPGDVIVTKRDPLRLISFDHEAGYWLIYKNGIQDFTKGLPVEEMDMMKFYFFKYSAIKDFVQKRKILG